MRIPPDLSRRKLHSLLDNYLRADYKIDCRGKVLDLGSRTHIMGILNVTPDSFSDGGRHADTEHGLSPGPADGRRRARTSSMSAENRRGPARNRCPEEEELRRIIPVIERLSSELTIPISVDTYKSSVARKALEAGASIVNDISGLRFSPGHGQRRRRPWRCRGHHAHQGHAARHAAEPGLRRCGRRGHVLS